VVEKLRHVAVEDLGALEVGRVPGFRDVHRTRHDGGDGVGGEGRDQDVLVACNEQDRQPIATSSSGARILQA